MYDTIVDERIMASLTIEPYRATIWLLMSRNRLKRLRNSDIPRDNRDDIVRMRLWARCLLEEAAGLLPPHQSSLSVLSTLTTIRQDPEQPSSDHKHLAFYRSTGGKSMPSKLCSVHSWSVYLLYQTLIK